MSPRGRPRAFDLDAALDKAMLVFWEYGYEGASLSDLTSAMGINSPSLYAAFGSKEDLFRAVIDRYEATVGGHTRRSLEGEPTARASVEAMLRRNVELYTDPAYPGGCMAVHAATNVTPAHRSVCAHLRTGRQELEELLRARLRRGIVDGDLPASVDVDTMAGFYWTFLHGLSVQARDGAGRAALNRLVDHALSLWHTFAGNDEGAAPEPAAAP